MQNLQIKTTLNLGTSATKTLGPKLRVGDSNIWQIVTELRDIKDRPVDLWEGEDIVYLFVRVPGQSTALAYTGTFKDEDTSATFTLDSDATKTVGTLECQVVDYYISNAGDTTPSMTQHYPIFEIEVLE